MNAKQRMSAAKVKEALLFCFVLYPTLLRIQSAFLFFVIYLWTGKEDWFPLLYSNLIFIRPWGGGQRLKAEFPRNWVYYMGFNSYKRSWLICVNALHARIFDLCYLWVVTIATVQVVTERSSSTTTDIPSCWFLVCTLLIITLKFNRTKISGCLPRHVFDVINFISLSFLQQTLQISSNILDKKNKAQWDELQEVHSRVYLLSKNFNLVSPSRKVGICTHYMPTIRPCSWRSTYSWSIFFPFTLSLRPQQKHKEGADLSQQICHSLRSFRNKYPTC